MASRRRTKQFGKTQIVADEGRYGAIAPEKRHAFATCSIVLLLGAKGEWSLLAVGTNQLPGGRKHQRLIPGLPVLIARRHAGDESEAHLFGDIGKEFLGLTAPLFGNS